MFGTPRPERPGRAAGATRVAFGRPGGVVAFLYPVSLATDLLCGWGLGVVGRSRGLVLHRFGLLVLLLGRLGRRVVRAGARARATAGARRAAGAGRVRPATRADAHAAVPATRRARAGGTARARAAGGSVTRCTTGGARARTGARAAAGLGQSHGHRREHQDRDE